MGVFLALFLAISVSQDQAPLRAGCAADAPVVKALPAGTPLTLRYVMAGESIPCYKVMAEVGGQKFEGYIAPAAIDDLESVDKNRRDASWMGTSAALDIVRSSQTLSKQPMAELTAPKTGQSGSQASTLRLLAQATELIEGNQPGKALALLEPEIVKRRDPNLLNIAGIAAWRADDSRRALEYWRSSLDLAPNPNLETLFKQVEREKQNDQSGEKLYGVNVVLRYEASAVPAETARQMVVVVDRTFARISEQLGCRAEEKIVTIVQSREAYKKATDAAEWSGGQYDGRIRIPALQGQSMNADAERVLAHETTHACLAMLGEWPSWLHEGLAQRLSGDRLSPQARQKLTELARAGQLPKLENLRQGWSQLDSEHAQIAYSLALAAAEILYTDFGSDGVRNLVRNPERLSAISAELDKRLGL